MRKVVIITGATDGLGKALAVLLSKKYDLAVCGRSSEKMSAVLTQLDTGADVYHECFDMKNDEAVHAFCNHVREHFSHVDVLINNAGANLKKERVEEMDISLLKDMLQLNCISQLEMIQEFYPMMKAEGDGHIINVLSSCCLFHNETMAGYTASKDAMDAISKTLLKEARKDNIKVTCVYPGGIDTNFRAVPNHDYLRPETVAKMIENAMEVEDGAVQELVIRPLVESNMQ